MSENNVQQIYPSAAWELLKSHPAAVLVDVRTPSEWKQIGVPDISELTKEPLFISWVDEKGIPNPEFMHILSEAVSPEQEIFFICRGGGRSQAAAQAAYAQGLENVYNVVLGFEGAIESVDDSTSTPHAGWQQSGLPWKKP